MAGGPTEDNNVIAFNFGGNTLARSVTEPLDSGMQTVSEASVNLIEVTFGEMNGSPRFVITPEVASRVIIEASLKRLGISQEEMASEPTAIREKVVGIKDEAVGYLLRALPKLLASISSIKSESRDVIALFQVHDTSAPTLTNLSLHLNSCFSLVQQVSDNRLEPWEDPTNSVRTNLALDSEPRVMRSNFNRSLNALQTVLGEIEKQDAKLGLPEAVVDAAKEALTKIWQINAAHHIQVHLASKQ